MFMELFSGRERYQVYNEMLGVVLLRVIIVSLSETVTCEYRLEGSKSVLHPTNI